jgi:hypothetical protein
LNPVTHPIYAPGPHSLPPVFVSLVAARLVVARDRHRIVGVFFVMRVLAVPALRRRVDAVETVIV